MRCRSQVTRALIICFALCCALPLSLSAQYARRPDRYGASIYVAPFSLLHGGVGRCVRIGAEQSLGERWALGGEYSHCISTPQFYHDLRGYRWHGELRCYFQQEQNVFSWMAAGIGSFSHNFSWEGELFDPTDSSRTGMTRSMTRRGEFLRFGIGVRGHSRKRFYFDGGLWAGIRHRDLDVQGLSEEQDDHFHPRRIDDTHSAAIQTTDTFTPEFLITVRVGFKIFSIEK